MRNRLPMNPSTLVLARSELAAIRLQGRTYRISCLAGRLWVTESGSPQDSVLCPGDVLTLTGRGRVVIEALRTATVRLEIDTDVRVKTGGTFALGRLPAGLLRG